jgi:hypothetical protein
LKFKSRETHNRKVLVLAQRFSALSSMNASGGREFTSRLLESRRLTPPFMLANHICSIALPNVT